MQGIDDVMASRDSAKDDVLAIEPGARNEGNEELGAISVGTSIGH